MGQYEATGETPGIWATHLMVDLETLSTAPDAAILSIGAVAMDSQFNQIAKFYTPINLADAIKIGMRIDASTIMWWMGQSEEARERLCKDQHGILQPSTTVAYALARFNQFIVGNMEDDYQIWANGPEYDVVVLTSALLKCNMALPWKFYNVRSYRELRYLYPDVAKPESTGTQHNALDDAKWQAAHLKLIMEERGRTGGA